MLDITTLTPALGTKQDSEQCTSLLSTLGVGEPTISTYPDGTFHNYHGQGVSLFFAENLDRIDFYNSSPSTSTSGRRRKPSPWSQPPEILFDFPSTTLPIPPPPARDPSLPPKNSTTTTEIPTSITRPAQLIIKKETTAKDLVECFGEPIKKGGTTAWIDTYIEWEVDVLNTKGEAVKLGVMVELREGPGEGIELWDRAKNWEWACLKVFLT